MTNMMNQKHRSRSKKKKVKQLAISAAMLTAMIQREALLFFLNEAGKRVKERKEEAIRNFLYLQEKANIERAANQTQIEYSDFT